MDRETLWRLFMETGAPEFYLLYHQTKDHAGELE